MMPNDKDGNDNERKNDESKMKSEINRLTFDYGIKNRISIILYLIFYNNVNIGVSP